jgi:hypothetical protein
LSYVLLFLCLTSPLRGLTVRAVSPDELRSWTRHLIPLPQELAIEHKVVLHPDEVGIRLEPGTGDIGEYAAEELKTLFATKAGVEAAGPGFEIVIGLARGTEAGRDLSAEERRRLRSLPFTPHGA